MLEGNLKFSISSVMSVKHLYNVAYGLVVKVPVLPSLAQCEGLYLFIFLI